MMIVFHIVPLLLSSQELIKVNAWILTIGKQSFAHCITPVCNLIENVLNVIQESIVHLTDIQLCEQCDATEATIELKILEGKLADFDRNNDSISEDGKLADFDRNDDSISEDGKRTAVADELEAQLQILTASQVGVSELQSAIDTLQNYITEL